MRALLRVTLVLAMFLFVSASVTKAGTSYATVSENWIGASIQTVDSDMADAFELPVSYGVIINRVIDDAPAKKAGLRQDDIVIAFNGTRVSNEQALRELIADSDIGDKVVLTVMRGDDKKEIGLKIAKKDTKYSGTLDWKQRRGAPGNFFNGLGATPPVAPGKVLKSSMPYLGVRMSDLTEQLGDYFGVPDGEGALVTEVSEDSPAESAGIKAGDVIVKVGDNDVVNSSDLSDLIGDTEVGDEIEIGVLRDKRSVTIKATIGETDASFFGSLTPLDDNFFDFSSLGNLRTLRFDPPMPRVHHNNIDGDFTTEMEQLRQELRELRKDFKELKNHRK